MKHNFKNYFKFGILFSGIIFFIWSCQKEESPILEQGNTQMFSPKSNINFNSFLNKFGTTTNAKSKTTTKQKHFSLENYTFGYLPNVASRESDQSIIQYIDTTTIVAFEFDNIQTYTFNIVPTVETENTFYNIIFYQNSEGTQSKLLKYESDFEWQNSNDTPFSGVIYEIEEDETVINTYTIAQQTSNTNVANRIITDCVFSISTVTQNCTGVDENDNPAEHAFGDPNCNCGEPGYISCTPAYEYTVVDLVCETYNTGGGEIPDEGGTTSGTENSNPNENDNGTFNLPTDPVKGSNINWTTFFNSLSTENQIFLNSNTIVRNLILNYLLQNYFSYESVNFVVIAIKAIANGGEVDFDDNVILDSTFVNNVKLKCVYDLLKESSSTLFNETVEVFIDDPKYNLIFKKGNCVTTDEACTNSDNIDSTGEVIITIENIGGSVLDLAALILHEAIHAEMARFVLRYANGEDTNDRPRIFQLYKYYENFYNQKDINHIYMTEKYINPIASALRKLDGNSYPLDYYKSYAWDGLRKWDANNLLSMEENTNYNDYKTIVEANTNLSCN